MANSNAENQYVQTRLLLALWDLNGLKSAVKKSDLVKRVKKSKEKTGDYTAYLNTLVEQGAISLLNRSGQEINAITKIGTLISLTPSGMQILQTGLMDQGFQFGGQQVGSRVANALLKWIREVEAVTKINDVAIAPKISTYDEFKSVALETYDQLNRDYNFDTLVPIYRIRRAIGDRVTRSQFNEWMLEMQAKDLFQLQGGGIEDDAPDKLEDSIMTKVSGLRCFAKRIA